MPISKYNAQFGGKPGSAAKAKAAMADTYGAEKGEQVFYATKNKRKSAGNPKPQKSKGKGSAFRGRGEQGGMKVGMMNPNTGGSTPGMY